jgi:hypothetical protein
MPQFAYGLTRCICSAAAEVMADTAIPPRVHDGICQED